MGYAKLAMSEARKLSAPKLKRTAGKNPTKIVLLYGAFEDVNRVSERRPWLPLLHCSGTKSIMQARQRIVPLA